MSVSKLDKILEEARLKREATVSKLKDQIFSQIFKEMSGDRIDKIIKMSKKSKFDILIDDLKIDEAILKFDSEQEEKKNKAKVPAPTPQSTHNSIQAAAENLTSRPLTGSEFMKQL